MMKFIFLSLLFLSAFADPDGCEVLRYSDLSTPPERSHDTRDTCPSGNGPRAFLHTLIESSGPGHLHHEATHKLQEVAPLPYQHFHCLPNRKCYIVVKGFGLRYLDALAILPVGQDTCPPSADSSDGMAVVVQSEFMASLTNNADAIPEASFAAFELPDRIDLENGTHTICYAPALASEAKLVDELETIDFHYRAGTLEIGDNLLSCDFERGSEGSGLEAFEQPGAGMGDVALPCGFKNYRPRWDINLVWQLGSGDTDTPGTGPHTDASPSSGGKGHYLYMDSPGYSLGAPAVLVSPPVAYPQGGFCAQFSYNMHGADVSTLRAYVHEVKLTALTSREYRHPPTDVKVNLLGDWGNPKWVAVGNKGESWYKGGFEFQATSMQTYQLVFEALAGKSEEGDIAIDEIYITPGRCPSDVRHNLPKTLGIGNQALVCGEVRLSTGAHAADKSWHVEGAVSCEGKGYSIDQMANRAWLPCCVPHFGTYKLVLEDKFGDGWTGSKLEFQFFDRIMVFGDDEFQQSGFDTSYNLVIGTLEVVDIQKPEDNRVAVSVRVARPKSFVWCGVIQAGKNGNPLKVDLTPALLKKYGVRSASTSSRSNEIVSLDIRNVLKREASYDLYCYSEIVGEKETEDDNDEMDQIKREIAASQIRFSTDRSPPQLSDLTLVEAFHSVNVTFTVNESASVYCAALKSVDKEKSALFAPSGPLAGLREKTDKESALTIARYFQTSGTGIDVMVASPNKETKQTIIIPSLIPDSDYDLHCYAEDFATPDPNRLSPKSIDATLQRFRTRAKVPVVKVTRRQTLHRGFRLFVQADAPGKVWCAAAPSDYGVPAVSEIVRVGATADIADPNKEVALEVRGVEANTAYVIYCVAGIHGADEEPGAEGVDLSTQADMLAHSVSVVSYGRYCEASEGDDVITRSADDTPFHPVTAEEEMQARSFVLGRSELGLQGVYRITLLPNKTEIYDYYDGKGPKPERYARVRAGRCVNDVGLYEQLKVGPLGGNRPLRYERVAAPIETECGGYNPQGVFGRRLFAREEWETATEALGGWFKRSFGFEFGTKKCVKEEETERVAGERPKHLHDGDCLELGPIFIQETCENEDENVPCNSNQRNGRVWVGLKTPTGEQIPFYFIYELPETSTSVAKDIENESPEEWVRRIIRGKDLPTDFHQFWEVTEIWIDGETFSSMDAVTKSIQDGNLSHFNPGMLSERRRLRAEALKDEAKAERKKGRKLEPQPFAGAAGTAGPIPLRTTRRGGLEYRAHPEHVESQGKRFTVVASSDDEAFTIAYAGWNMTVANDRDTALKVYHLTFQNQRVAFELGLMEALAHYSVSERNWFFLDSWYGGLGAAARKVHKGIECPKTAVSLFWDGSLCVFEQDMARPIRSHWKSGEIRDGSPHVSLVLRQMLTVSNYDYVTDYRFHLNGIFESSVTFTGELYAGIEVPWYSSRQSDYGVQVTGAMRFAALHSHMAAWKIDFDVGEGDNWKENSVYLTEVIPDPSRPGANKLKKSFAETESEAAYFRNDTRALSYEVVDEKLKIFGNIGGWRVVPYPGINPLHHDFELYSGPAAWAKYRAFSTVHKYGELDSTLPRDNKFAKRPAVSVDRYVLDNEPIRNVDVVTWLSDGIFHIPVIEDMPLTIPVGNQLGWMVKPSNLFLEDPSMDLQNAMGGGVEDPGTCAVVRVAIGEVEPLLDGTWHRAGAAPVRNQL